MAARPRCCHIAARAKRSGDFVDQSSSSPPATSLAQLDRSRSGRWTDEMPPAVQHYAALNLGPMLEEHGYGEAVCHALGAYRHFPCAMTVVNIGGQEPRVIQVDADASGLSDPLAKSLEVNLRLAQTHPRQLFVGPLCARRRQHALGKIDAGQAVIAEHG